MHMCVCVYVCIKYDFLCVLCACVSCVPVCPVDGPDKSCSLLERMFL